ncbi:hypothetical protein [Faecalimicrobium sp. JNUCC 81]
MEKSFIFNSINGDRKMKAEDFREYFIPFISNGIYPNPSTKLQVVSNTGMKIIVKEGKAFINGSLYINTDDLVLTLDHADGVLDRIDRIVLRMDTIERNIKCIVKKGQFASNPVAPSLQRDADAHELCIAEILISKGSIDIQQSMIADTRLNTEICGIVTGLIKEIDTTTLYNQLQAHIQEKGIEMNEWLKGAKVFFENDFNTWFDTVKGVLDGDVAGNLLNEINKLKETVDNLELVASNVTMSDGSTVEEAISSAKTSISSLSTEVEEVKQYGVDFKTEVASAITAKNVPTLATDDKATFVNNINSIRTGVEPNGTLTVSIFTQEEEPIGELKDGDMWLMVNEELSEPTFSLTEPTNPIDGMLWITYGEIDMSFDISNSLEFLNKENKEIYVSFEKSNLIANTPKTKVWQNGYMNLYTSVSHARYFKNSKWHYIEAMYYKDNSWHTFDRRNSIISYVQGTTVYNRLPNGAHIWNKTFSGEITSIHYTYDGNLVVFSGVYNINTSNRNLCTILNHSTGEVIKQVELPSVTTHSNGATIGRCINRYNEILLTGYNVSYIYSLDQNKIIATYNHSENSPNAIQCECNVNGDFYLSYRAGTNGSGSSDGFHYCIVRYLRNNRTRKVIYQQVNYIYPFSFTLDDKDRITMSVARITNYSDGKPDGTYVLDSNGAELFSDTKIKCDYISVDKDYYYLFSSYSIYIKDKKTFETIYTADLRGNGFARVIEPDRTGMIVTVCDYSSLMGKIKIFKSLDDLKNDRPLSTITISELSGSAKPLIYRGRVASTSDMWK